MNSAKAALVVIASIAVGASIGVLFAPDKGTSTRKKIYKKGDDYVEELERKFSDFMSSITRRFESAKKEAMDAVENGRARIESAKEKAESVKEAAKAVSNAATK